MVFSLLMKCNCDTQSRFVGCVFFFSLNQFPNQCMITDDKVILGVLISTLFFVFYLAKLENQLLKRLFSVLPPVLFCYFLPGLFNTIGLIKGNESGLYKMASNYLLPVCLLFFTLTVDFKALRELGFKAIIVFLSGSLGIIIGGPVALFIVKLFFPQLLIDNPDLWRGTATIAGSWIGGGANQTALKEIFQPSDYIFSQTVAVDIIVAETWLAVLLIGVSKNDRINRWLGVKKQFDDTSLISSNLIQKEVPTFFHLFQLLIIGFGSTSLAHFVANLIAPLLKENYPFLESYSLTSPFFWVVFVVTLLGLLYSQTSLRNLEKYGASIIGNVFLYILIATIGMQMDIAAIFTNPVLFLFGVIWMLVHFIFMLTTAKFLKAPYFFVAVGSQANVGGAASAPIVASAFNPNLAPVGVILAILGYLIGTYGGYISALMMKWVVEN